MPPTLPELRQTMYDLLQDVNGLRREIYAMPTPGSGAHAIPQDRWEALVQAEKKLADAEQDLAAAEEPADPIISTKKDSLFLGMDSTGLEVTVNLTMSPVPTSFYHLLEKNQDPLVICTVQFLKDTHNTPAGVTPIRRVRVTSFIEGYSARAVDTVELKLNQKKEFRQSPTLFPRRMRKIRELTSATLNVMVEDLDTHRVEIHKTSPVRLLARQAALLEVKNPQTGQSVDLKPYLAAFVTPNDKRVLTFLNAAVEKHPRRHLVGYNNLSERDASGNVIPKNDIVTSQVQAIYEALQAAGITYVDSIVYFNPDSSATGQRLRLPRESLRAKQANCLDGAVLFASLLEAASLSPAIAIAFGHAVVGWETWRGSGEWSYLETTWIKDHPFTEACKCAEEWVTQMALLAGEAKRLEIRSLRTVNKITPIE